MRINGTGELWFPGITATYPDHGQFDYGIGYPLSRETILLRVETEVVGSIQVVVSRDAQGKFQLEDVQGDHGVLPARWDLGQDVVRNRGRHTSFPVLEFGTASLQIAEREGNGLFLTSCLDCLQLYACTPEQIQGALNVMRRDVREQYTFPAGQRMNERLIGTSEWIGFDSTFATASQFQTGFLDRQKIAA